MTEPVTDVEAKLEARDGVDGRFRRVRLGDTGGQRLGCSLYEVPPGGQPWSYHYHVANEEALYVLKGQATVELEGVEHLLEAGDYLSFPAGPDGVHVIRNEGDATLRYLVVSTNDRPDVTVLPRRGLFGVGLDDGDEPPGGPTVGGFYPVDAELQE